MTQVPAPRAPSFAEIVKEEFSFLDQTGSSCTMESENSVRYELSNGVFVRVFRDERDSYVGFRIGLISRPRDALTAKELLTLSQAPGARGDYPEDRNQLRGSVVRIASQLRAHGQRAMSGDESIYDDAMDLRRTYTEGYVRRGGEEDKKL